MKSEIRQSEMLQWTGECEVSACAHSSLSWTNVLSTGSHTTGPFATDTHTTGTHTSTQTTEAPATDHHVQDLKSNVIYHLASRRHFVTNTSETNLETQETMSRDDDGVQVAGHPELIPGVDNLFQYKRTPEDTRPVTNGGPTTRQTNLRQSSDQSLDLTASADWSDPICLRCAPWPSAEMKDGNRKYIHRAFKNHFSPINLRNGESNCMPQYSAILSLRDSKTQNDTFHQLTGSSNHLNHAATLYPGLDTQSWPCVCSSNHTIFQTLESGESSSVDSLHKLSPLISYFDTTNHDHRDSHESNSFSCVSKGNAPNTDNGENSPVLENGQHNFRSKKLISKHRRSIPGNLTMKLMLLSDMLARSFLPSRDQRPRISSCQSLPDLALAQTPRTHELSSRAPRPPSKVSAYLDLHLAQSVKRCRDGAAVVQGRRTQDQRIKRDEKSELKPRASQLEASGDLKCMRLEASHVHQVYQKIAPQCDHVRHKAWPNVKQFLKGLQPGSLVADVGCGSGRYLRVNPQVLKFGSDICRPFLDQARCQGHEVLMADNMALPYRDGVFDAVCSIGVIHHFASLDRRVVALRELSRVLAPGGKLMVYVWAFEQTNRKFNCQDVLIPWVRPVTKSNSRSNLCYLGGNTNTSCSAENNTEYKKGQSTMPPSYHRAQRKRVKSNGDGELKRPECSKRDNVIPTRGQGDNLGGLGTYPRRRLLSDDGPYTKCDDRGRFVTKDAHNDRATDLVRMLSACERPMIRRAVSSEASQLVSGGDRVISPWCQNDSEVGGGKLAKLPSQLVSECRKLGKLIRSLSFKSDSSCGDECVELNFNEGFLDNDDFKIMETRSDGDHGDSGEHISKTVKRVSETTNEPSENLSTQAFHSVSNDELSFSGGQVWGHSASRLHEIIPNREAETSPSTSFCGSDAAVSTDCPSWCSETTVVSEGLDTRSTVTFTNSEFFQHSLNHEGSLAKSRPNPFSKTPPEMSSSSSVTEHPTEDSSNSARQRSFTEDTSLYSSDSVFLERQSSETEEETSSSEEGGSDQSTSSENAGGEEAFIDDVLGIQNRGQYPTARDGSPVRGGSPIKSTSTYYNTINKINAMTRCQEKSTVTTCRAERFSISQSVRSMFSKITEAFHVKKKDSPMKLVEKPRAPIITGIRPAGITPMRPVGTAHVRKSDQATLEYYREISFLSSKQAYRNLQTVSEAGRASTNVHKFIKGRRPNFLDFTKKRCRAGSQLVPSTESAIREDRKLTLSDALTLLGEGVSEESLLDKLDSSARIIFRDMKEVNFGIRQFPMSSVEPAVGYGDKSKFCTKVKHGANYPQPLHETKVTQSPQEIPPGTQELLRDKQNENQQNSEVFSLNHCSRNYFSSTSGARGNSVTIDRERRMSIQLDHQNMESFDLLERPVCSMWSEAFQDRSNNASSTEISGRQTTPRNARESGQLGNGAPEQNDNCCYYSSGKLDSSDNFNGEIHQCGQEVKNMEKVNFICRHREISESTKPLSSDPQNTLHPPKVNLILRQDSCSQHTPTFSKDTCCKRSQDTPIFSKDTCINCSRDTPRCSEYTPSSSRSTTRSEPNADPTTKITPKPPDQPITDVQNPAPYGHHQPVNRSLSRYYHVFKQGELVRLISDHVPSLRVHEAYYDHANWCIVAHKI